MAVERLQKILSHAGVSSRRAAEELIRAGRVAVNGTVARELGSRADTERDDVTVDGVPVLRKRYRYVALHKPRGVLSAAEDERGRQTVRDLVATGEQRLHPVGRLDLDSEGLILLTNDGHLTEFLTHPRHEVEKEYLVQIDQPVAKRDMERMVRGIEEQGERLRASRVTTVQPPGAQATEHWLLVVLKQGRKREIRRMLRALDREVLVLRRTRIGPLRLGDLAPGAWRELDENEVARLYDASTGKGPTG